MSTAAAPQLGVARRQRQRHVAAVRAADDTGARRVHPRVVRQHLGHRMNMVEPVEPAPVAVDPLRVVEAVAGRAARVRHEHGEPLERQELDQRHREPREVRPLLALRSAVDVVHERPRPVEAELGRRQVQPRRYAQPVVRLERGVLAGARAAPARVRARARASASTATRRQPGARGAASVSSPCRTTRRSGRSLVVVEAVEHAAGELALADEHSLDRERARRLVERAGVDPRAAVDVVGQRVAVAVEVVDPLELADALVRETGDRDRLDVAGPIEVEVRERPGVVVQRRRDQKPCAARRPVAPAEPGREAWCASGSRSSIGVPKSIRRAPRRRPRTGRRRPSCTRRRSRRARGRASTPATNAP